METYNKVKRLQVRLTVDEVQRLKTAAAIVTRKRRESIKPPRLIREIVLPEVDRIIAEEGDRQHDTAAA